MKRIITNLVLLVMCCLLLTGCFNAIPEVSPQTTAIPPEISAALAERESDAKMMKYLVDFLMHLEPILSEEEQAKLDAEQRQKMPYRASSPELVNYCTSHANAQMTEFLNDFTSEKYELRKQSRALKQIYDGETGVEINGGIEPKIIGFETGYWRITDCNYYNLAFFSNKEHNSVRVLYRCNLYHYLQKKADDLTNAPQNTEVMTTENTDVQEYENAFLVVTINNVCPVNINEPFTVLPQEMRPEVLMFKDYESAIKSFKEPKHTIKELYLTKDYEGSVVNGYIGKPLVTMPDLVGQFVDVSQPDNVVALDELGITNYKVVWEENDGSKVAYSILSTNKEAGSIVDITDSNASNCIEVVVAKKAAVAEPTA